jgi:hypothetical protein
MPAFSSASTKGCALPSKMGTSSPFSSIIALSLPFPPRSYSVHVLTWRHYFYVVLRFVSTTKSTSALTVGSPWKINSLKKLPVFAARWFYHHGHRLTL